MPKLGRSVTNFERSGSPTSWGVSKYGPAFCCCRGVYLALRSWNLDANRITEEVDQRTLHHSPGYYGWHSMWIGSTAWPTERYMAIYLGLPWISRSGGRSLLDTHHWHLELAANRFLLWEPIHGARGRGRRALSLTFVDSLQAGSWLTDTERWGGLRRILCS